MKYFIQSNKNGMFLSHLYGDCHDEMFRAARPKVGRAYFYGTLLIAQDVAAQLNGKVFQADIPNRMKGCE